MISVLISVKRQSPESGDGQFAVVGAVLSTISAIFTVPPAETADTTYESAIINRRYRTKSKVSNPAIPQGLLTS
jgi:hypothetical protein